LEELNPGTGVIGRRQLYDDIKFMESEGGWSVPLERYKDGTNFRVTSPNRKHFGLENPYLKGLEFIGVLFLAISNKTPLEFWLFPLESPNQQPAYAGPLYQ